MSDKVISLADKKRELEAKKKKAQPNQDQKDEKFSFEDIMDANEQKKKKMESKRLEANEQVKRSYKLKNNK